MLFSISNLIAQFPIKDTLNANSPSIRATPFLSKDCLYKVRVSGKYSQWGNTTQESNSVDAAYYWEKANTGNVLLDLILKSIVTEPKWLGDSVKFSIPNVPSGFSFKNNIGFRLNRMPVPFMPYDSINHTYEYLIQGNNALGELQILDSVIDLNKRINIPRYEDNKGKLFIEIDEVCNVSLNVCDTYCEKTKSGDVFLAVATNISNFNFAKNTNSSEMLSLFVNGEKLAADSISCYTGNPKSIAVSFLLDASQSMEEPIDEKSFKPRIECMKSTVIQIANSIGKREFQADEYNLASFSKDRNELQSWSYDFVKAPQSLLNFRLDSASNIINAFYSSMDLLKNRKSDRKALVLFTDGFNTNKIDKDKLKEKLKNEYSGIDVFPIALAVNDDDIDNNAIKNLNMFLVPNTNKQVTKVNDSLSIKKMISKIIYAENQTNCCYHYFKLPFEKLSSINSLEIGLSNNANSKVKVEFDCATISNVGANESNEETSWEIYSVEGVHLMTLNTNFFQILEKLEKGFYIMKNRNKIKKLEVVK